MKFLVQLILVITYLFSAMAGQQMILHLCSSEACMGCEAVDDTCCKDEQESEASDKCCNEIIIQVYNEDSRILNLKDNSISLKSPILTSDHLFVAGFGSLQLRKLTSFSISREENFSRGFQDFHLVQKHIFYS